MKFNKNKSFGNKPGGKDNLKQVKKGSFSGAGGGGGRVNKNKDQKNGQQKFRDNSKSKPRPGGYRDIGGAGGGGSPHGGFKKFGNDKNRSGGGGGFQKFQKNGGVGGKDKFQKKKKPDNPNFAKLGKNDRLKGPGFGKDVEIKSEDDEGDFEEERGSRPFDFKDVKTKSEIDEEELGGGGPEDFMDDDDGGKKGKNKNKKKTGGFQSMGLSPMVLKGVLRRGYQVPTPIQRKTIPLILEGRDVVAMARTGSGKTAAFLIPLFEKLHLNKTAIGSATKYPRALILSPTRELATQTVKFFRELGRFVDLKVATILGGDSMESQFQTMHDKPDVVIATPGRLMHLLVEMEMNLDGVEYIVFDEADRLFEMGFGEQVTETVKRLPETRQTVLFSATLPKLLVEFTKAGLHDPSLIRLDVDTKLPDRLELIYLACRSEDKVAALLHLLKNVVEDKGQTIVFAATKHHVEYLHQLLDESNISNCYIYSSLDPTARKISIAKFRGGKCNVMIVTDIAARGIDIPILDNVINFHFPAKPKLFMHRVGRVARAGRSGIAYSIISPDEIAFLLDLHLFLNKPLRFSKDVGKNSQDDECIIVGRVPQDFLNEENGIISNFLTVKAELETLDKTCRNGYRQYLKSRPNASTESNRRAKDIKVNSSPVHPIFAGHIEEDAMDSLISQMQSYRPNSTIFEIGPKSGSETVKIMKTKRIKDQRTVEKYRSAKRINSTYDMSATTENTKDEENFIPYLPKDHHTETGLSVGTTFDKQIQQSVMDITGDDSDMLKNQRTIMKWDQKKKKYIRMGKDDKGKKIKTESGTWIAASYKSDRYKSWKEKSKVEQQNEGDNSEDEEEEVDDYSSKGSNPAHRKPAFSKRLVKTGKNEAPGGGIRRKGEKFNTELKRPEQILKDRKVKEKKRLKNSKPQKKKGKGREGKGGGKSSSFGKKKKA